MSDNITQTGELIDPLANGTFIVEEFVDNQQIDMGDVYHKVVTVKFNKPNANLDAKDTLTSQTRIYENYKIGKFIKDSTDVEKTGIAAYSIESYRRNSFDYLKTDNEVNEQIETDIEFEMSSEREIDSFYTDKEEATDQRHIVFDSSFDFAGSPESDKSKNKFYNSIYMTWPTKNVISQYMQDADQLNYGFNLYERMMVLIGHYADNIKALGFNDNLTIQTLIDRYDYPFPTDAYYVISNADTAQKSPDLSYDVLEQEILRSIKKTISENSMIYSEMFLNEENQSEYLFFKVEKWFSEDPVGTPGQIFFLPATDTSKLFIDKQIKDNKSYFYRVTAYYSVVTQEYYFTDVNDYGETGDCKVHTYPVIKLYSTMAFQDMLDNIAPPPLPPFVSIHNKMSSAGKIKIYLELQKGEHKAHPIAVSNETNRFNRLDILPGGFIQYRYSKGAAMFEAYRMSEPPKSYADFAENFIGQFENSKMMENMVVLDGIRPNKKYYYIFRTVNRYGSFSNPSPVYEVELLKDADSSRVLVNSYLIKDETIEEEESKSYNINLRSLLQLNVAEQQLAFNLDDILGPDGTTIDTYRNKVNLISLGKNDEAGAVLEHKVWGRKFKFRIRSNDSGKIIDFNIKVNLIKDEHFSV